MEKVNTNKKQYNKPMLISEEFVPNEYVAACFKLACEHAENESNSGGGCTHRNLGNWGGCKNANSQSISVNDGGYVSVVEVGNEYTDQETLPCVITHLNGESKSMIKAEEIKTGDVISWYTQGTYRGDPFLCNHYATVNLTDKNKTANHS